MAAESALIGLAVGFALLAIIAIILAIFLYLSRRQNSQLSSDLEVAKSLSHGPVKRINSLPCRLKKTRSRAGGAEKGSDRSASESGVYDMTSELGVSSHSNASSDNSQTQMVASYVNQSGAGKKVYITGEVTGSDIISLRHALSHFIQFHAENSEPCQPNGGSPSSLKTAENADQSISLDDVIFSGLSTPDFSFDNECFVKDEDTTPSKTWKNHPVARSLSALARKRKQRNMESRQLSRASISELSSLHEASDCVYKVALVSQAGGDIQLEGGVRLEIPPNALSGCREIALGVTYRGNHLPALREGQTILSPVVFCQPSGLTFRHAVKIQMPHCAENAQSNWKITILMSQNEAHEEKIEWKALQIGDYESRTINKANIELEVSHFTMYCIVGEAKPEVHAVKHMTCVVLSPPTRDHIWTPWSYVVNKYASENRVKPESSDPSIAVNSALTNSELCLTLEEFKDSTIFNSSVQSVPIHDLWLKPINSLKYKQRTPAESITEVQYRLLISQGIESEEDYSIFMSLNEEGNPINSRSCGRRKPRRVFTETLKWDIILLLDQQCYQSDWRQLAKEMHLNESTVKELSEKPSPTKELLGLWESEHHGCIRSFVAVCVKINRFDVAEKVEEHIGKLYLETLSNHRCDEHC